MQMRYIKIYIYIFLRRSNDESPAETTGSTVALLGGVLQSWGSAHFSKTQGH